MATSAHLRTKASLGQLVSSNSPFLDHYQLLSSIPPSVEISRTVLSFSPPPPSKGPWAGWLPHSLFPNELAHSWAKCSLGHSRDF